MLDKGPETPPPNVDLAQLLAWTDEGNALQAAGDTDGAIEAYRRAAEGGFLGAMGNLADALVFRYPKDPAKHKEAFDWYEKAALQARDYVAQTPGYQWPSEVRDGGISDVFIKYALTLQWYQRPDEARYWYQQCAALGDPRGYAALAQLHSSWDPQGALDLWDRAADLALASLREINADRGALELSVGSARLELLIAHRSLIIRQHAAYCAHEPLPAE